MSKENSVIHGTLKKVQERGYNMHVSNRYYLSQLQEQSEFLIEACRKYDKGSFAYAKQMSAIIRTLVKDNPKNKQTVSLLTSLNVKDKTKFYNTAYSAKDPAILLNLVGLYSQYKPILAQKAAAIYIPMFDDTDLVDVEWIEFDDWWETDIIVCRDDKNDFSLSRKKIILTMAEQDGGVHVDNFEKMDSIYKGIITCTVNIMTHITPDGDEIPMKYLQYALVRQIAHEIIITLQKICGISLQYTPTLEYILNGDSKDKIIKPFMVALNDGDLSTRTETPKSGERGPGIIAPPGTAYVRLEIKNI